MPTLQIRITSPRWDGEADRWQMPGEMLTISEDDLPHYAYHGEVVRPPVPHPDSPLPSFDAPALPPDEVDDDEEPEPRSIPNKVDKTKPRRK